MVGVVEVLVVDVVEGQINWRLLECACVLESISDVDVSKEDTKF